MKTENFRITYPYPKLKEVSASTTSFTGGNKFHIRTPLVVSVTLTSPEHKNFGFSLERKEALLLIKELRRELKISRTKRK